MAFSMANGYKQVLLTSILPNGVFFLMPLENQQSDELMNITYQMGAKFSSASSRTYSPEPGAYCCAFSKADGIWYRAVVKEMLDDSHCCVIYPDYGNEEVVPVERMRQHEDSFFQYPFLSQTCILGDFVPRNNQWTPNLINLFQKMAFNQNFYACYHGLTDEVFPPLNTTPLEVSLYQDVGNTNSVTDILIQLGYGFPTIPNLHCPTSVPMECHVCYCQAPLEFWLQLDANTVFSENLHHQMNQKKHTQLKLLPVVAHYPGVGCMVVVKEKFCRAKIIHLNDPNTCTVLLVDSGETCTVPTKQLYTLLPEFYHLSAQATKCALYGICLPDSPQKVDALSNRFQQLVTGVSLTANFFMKDNDVHLVVLTNLATGVLISDQLISEGLVPSQDGAVSQVSYISLECGDKESILVTAVETPTMIWGQLIRNTDAVDELMEELYKSYSTTSPEMIKTCEGDVVAAQFTLDEGWYRALIRDTNPAENCVDVFYIDYGNSETVMVEKLRELKPEFLRLPAQAINFSLYGIDVDHQWSPTEIARLEGLILNKVLELSVMEKDTSDSRPKVKLIDKMVEDTDIIQLFNLTKVQLENPPHISGYKKIHPKAGSKIPVQITYGNSPVDFYCQQLEQGDKFGQLLSDINNYCESGNAILVTMPTVGAAVLAQYDVDMVWYRGEITEVSGDTCKVLFVDYGNIETIDNQKVYAILAHFLHLPAQAIHCSLDGVSPNVTQDQVDAFESLVQQSLLCSIDSVQDDVCSVTLAHSDGTPITIPSGAVVQPPTLDYGVPISVYVSFCEGPESFWCQRQKEETQLQSLVSHLNKFYEAQPPNDQQLYMLYVGMLCCARYASDGAWYRAQVSEVHGNAVTVYFFDYGNYEEYTDLPSPDVKQLDDCFLNIPAFAIHCKLTGLTEHPSVVATQFEELVMSDVIVATFLSENDEGVIETELRQPGSDGAKILDLIQNGISSNQQPLPQLLLTVGTSTSVLVTAFANKSEFYCQLLSNDSSLTDFMHNLDSYYNSLGQTELTCHHLTVRFYACGQFTENDCWYRVILKDIRSNKEVLVMYIDYGNEEVLPLARIKHLAPQFMSYPMQAVRCSLFGVDDSTVSEEFSDLLLNKEFHLTAEQALDDGSYRVSLIGIDGSDVINEASKLGLLIKKSVDGTQPATGQWLPSIVSQLEVGNIVDVVVTHVESPSHFYCNLIQFSDHLAAVTNAIATKGVSASPLLHPEVGVYCLARYSVDGEWYRAHVISVSGNHVMVQFVDYGNVENVPMSDLKQLNDQQLCGVAMQAVKCGLAHMRPFRGSHWSAASCDFLIDTILDQTLIALVQELTPGHAEMILTTTDDKDIAALLTAAGHAVKQSQSALNYKEQPIFCNVPYSLYICYVESPSGVNIWCQLSSCVNELNMLMDQLAVYCATAKEITAGQVCLGMACCVQYEDGGWYRGLVMNVAPDNRFEVLLVDFGNVVTVRANEMREIKTNQLVLPKQAFCCVHDSNLTMTFDSEISGILRSRNADGIWNLEPFDAKKEEKVTIITKYNPFETTPDVDVFVTFVASPAQFYCQASDSYDRFNEMMTQMQSHDFASMVTPPLQEGTFCSARYSEDGQWYRAKIMSVDSPSDLRVLFIDYGNTECVDSKDVKALPPIFAELSAQAICCSLPTETAVTIDQEGFTDIVSEQQFKATLVDVLPDLTCAVTLTSPSTGEKLFMPPKQITIPPLVLSPGAVEVAYVSHVESPTHFYCQLDRTVSDLTSMQHLLADVCNVKHCVIQPVSEGMYYAVRYSVDHEWYRAQIIGVNGKQTTVRFCDYGNTDTVDASKSIVTLDDQFSSLPSQAVLCSLGDHPKMSTIQLTDLIDSEVTISVEKITKDRFHLVHITTVDQLLEIPSLDLSLNEPIPVVITHCISPQDFYCQDQRAISEMEQLLVSLSDLEAGPVPKEVSVDMYCAACFSEDDRWYRAKVTDIATPQKVTVLFVDYGNDDVVSENELRCLTAELCKLPSQAFHCTLLKSPPTKPLDSDSFISEVLNQEFTASVVDFTSDGFVVTLRTELGKIIDGPSLCQTSSQAPVSIPKLKVPLNVPHEICVVFAVEPSEIYCQLMENTNSLDEVMAQLELTVSGHMTSPDPGLYCTARYFEDQIWYRAKVLETHNGDAVTVHFVDYGNVEEVTHSELAPLDPQLCTLPAQAVRCSLKQDVISNIESSTFDISWIANAASAIFSSGPQAGQLEAIFLDADGNDMSKGFPVGGAVTACSNLPRRGSLESGTSVSIIVSYIESDDVFYCQLEEWLTELNEMQAILEQFCEGVGLLSNQSVQVDNYVIAEYSEDGLWYRAKILEVNSDSTAVVFFLDYGNKETVSKMAAIPDSLISTPPVAIECHLKSKADLEDGSALVIDILEVLNDQYIVQLHTEEEIKDIPELTTVSPVHLLSPSRETRSLGTKSLSIGTPCEVIVSHIEGPTMFFVQQLQSSSDLNELMDKMFEDYSNEPTTTVVPSKGMICAALFGDDGSWYRARVISSTGDDVTLFYLDYGNTDTVSIESIQPIKDEYCVLPAQAIKCATIATIGDDEFIETMSNMECVVTATKITAGNTHLVEMTTMDGEPLVGQPVTKATDSITGSPAADIIKPQRLAVSTKVSVFVTHVASPLSFWCRPLSSYEQLDAVMATMADYYNEHIKPLSSVTMGTIVAAQYSVDGSWYRAEVLSVSDDSVSVLFVDYGNSEFVTMDKIQPINDQFLSLPTQAIHCSITTNAKRSYSPDVINTFVETIYEQEVSIVVQQVLENNLHIVQLETSSGDLLDHLFTPTPDNEDANIDDVSSNEAIPVDYRYPTIQLDEGNEVDVYISYVESPASFFCQPLNLGGDLERMMQELEKAMQEPRPLPAASVGQVCATRYSQDGVWYRAVAVKSYKDDDNGDDLVTVNFVDYGNSEVTNIESLACLPEKFLVLPAQAIQCSCVDSGVEKFPDHVVQQFCELICEGEQYTITVEQLLGYGKYYVLVSNTEGEVNVTELLQDVAVGSSSIPTTMSPALSANEELSKVAMTAEEAQEEEMVDRLLKLPILQHQQVPHENTRSSNGTPGSPEELKMPFQLSLTPREIFMGNISHVENPSLFYVQRSDCASELLTLEADIEEHCTNNPILTREVWSVGSFGLAMSTSDVSCWRRAEVKETFLDGMCEVLFIDYGNTSMVPLDSLRPCPETCNALPMQAIVCSLAHVPRREEQWPAYYKELMEEFALNKELRISVAVPGTQGMRPAVVVEATGSGAELSQKVLEKLQAECEGGSTSLSLAEEEDNEYLEPLASDNETLAAFADKSGGLLGQLHNGLGVTIEGLDKGESEDECYQDDQDWEELKDWLGPVNTAYHKLELTVDQVITFTHLCGKAPDNLIGYLYSEKWEELMQEISSYANSCNQIESINDILSGKPIIAYYNNIWHRGHVTTIDYTSESLTVYLPDNHSTAKVGLPNVRPMKSNFMLLPSQAVQCALIGVEPLQYEWGKNSNNVLKVLTHVKRPLDYVVVNVEPTKVVACLNDEVVWTEVFVACCVSRVLAELEETSALLEHEQ